MSKDMRDTISANCISILKYWHNIEFFIPFDLQGQVLDEKYAAKNVRCWTRDKLATARTCSLWNFAAPSGKELAGFDVFLGIFDKRALAEVTQRVLKQSVAQGELHTQEERGDLEGLTCCARIKANQHGELVLDNVSVSSAP